MSPERPLLNRDRQAELLALAGELRPDLHRYCARLMGSVIDGEDVVQDTLIRLWRCKVYELRRFDLGCSGLPATARSPCPTFLVGRWPSFAPVISAAMKRPTSVEPLGSCICASGSPTPIGCSRTKSGRC